MFLFPLPRTMRTDECIIYHDESKGVFENVWAHGLLFVPESASMKLLELLWAIRERHSCENNKLHFCNISGSRICPDDGSVAIKEWVLYGVETLKSKHSPVFRPPLNCKLGVIFFPTTLDLDTYGGDTPVERMLRYFETVFRMVLKGCAHYLYDQNNKLRIKGVITDGEPWHRRLDETRILRPLMAGVRDYVEIDRNAYVEGIISDHTSCDCADSNKAQFLQLTDLLLGSIIHTCFRDLEHGSKKEILIRPVREMLEKRKRGRNFHRSGHYKSFSLSFAELVGNQWRFQPVDEKEIIYEGNQLELFEFNTTQG